MRQNQGGISYFIRLTYPPSSLFVPNEKAFSMLVCLFRLQNNQLPSLFSPKAAIPCGFFAS